MIEREAAIDRAIEYLGRQYGGRLKPKRGWPPGAFRPPGDDKGTVWLVAVPDDRRHVGASRFIVIDGATGKIIADQRIGE
ncbi:MAG: hypothetical protein ACREUG_09545 [Steroidobacteraceae bacterium]